MQTSLQGWLRKTSCKNGTEEKKNAEGEREQVSKVEDSIDAQQLSTDSTNAGVQVGLTGLHEGSGTINRPTHSNVSIISCTTKSQVSQLQKINSVLLPIPYPKAFYDEIVSDHVTASITLIAVWNDNRVSDKVIGGIRCRLLNHNAKTPLTNSSTSASQAVLSRLHDSLTSFTSLDFDGEIDNGKSNGDNDSILYISTLALLSPYRGMGIATSLLEMVCNRAKELYAVNRVGAHVWSENEEALKWYSQRQFQVLKCEEGYYKRLQKNSKDDGSFKKQSGDAVVVVLDI